MSRVVLVLTLVAALGCEAQRAIPEPPAGSYTTGMVQVTIGGVSATLLSASVTQDFFKALGARPLLGRFFIDGDYTSSTRVAVLSYNLWTERLAAAPGVIGQIIEVDGHPVVIVGIAPRELSVPASTQLWMPK